MIKTLSAIAIAFLLAAQSLGQNYGGSLDSDSGLLLTPPQRYAREMRVPDRVTWSDPTIVRLEGGGTGTVIAIGGKPFVASCAHDHDGYVQMGQRAQFQSNNGERATGEVVAFDAANDCSLWLLMTNFKSKPRAVTTLIPRAGERVRTAGFPMGQQLRDRYTRVLASSGREMHIRAGAIPGDSGGPVFNEHGQLCGIVFGGDMTDENGHRIPGAMCCGPEPIQRLMTSVAKGVAITQTQYSCANGSCYQTWSEPVVVQRPPVSRPPVQPSVAPCTCADKWEQNLRVQQTTAAALVEINQLIKQQNTNIGELQQQVEVNSQAVANVQQDLQQTIDNRVSQYMQQHPQKAPPTVDEIVTELEKRRTPARIRIVDPQGKFTTQYVDVRDGHDIDLIIDQRFIQPAQ